MITLNRPTRSLIPRSRSFPESVFPSLFGGFPTFDELGQRIAAYIENESSVSVSEDDKNVYITADLPGFTTNDIDVSIHRNIVVIQGKRKEEEESRNRRYSRTRRSSFYYEVELPCDVEEEPEQANYDKGVLNLTFTKTREESVKKIQIKGNSATGATPRRTR